MTEEEGGAVGGVWGQGEGEKRGSKTEGGKDIRE